MLLKSSNAPWDASTSLCLYIYISELARHQHRVFLFRYNLDLSCVFGVIDTPVYDHA